MDIIKVLDKATAEKIAAGEVVQNPASVVKELIENSIDAKSTAITIEILNGGIKKIRITDNGIGMSKNDAKNAFLRHATSKIKNADDINSIMSLGFRGEALAAISAVSKVELYTKQEQDNEGTHIVVNGGEFEAVEIAYPKDGTSITISDLFYNTPARLKFLKSESSESAAVYSVVEKIALSHPEISFKLIRNDKQALYTLGENDLYKTVINVLGKEFSNTFIETEYEENSIKISGYISKPSFSKANRKLQNFYINKRIISSKVLTNALELGYKDCLLSSTYPTCVLFIDIDPSMVDINVHPAKTQVKFYNDNVISNIVMNCVKQMLKKDDGRVNMKSLDNFEYNNPVFENTADQLSYISKPLENSVKAVTEQKESTEYKSNIFIEENDQFISNVKLNDLPIFTLKETQYSVNNTGKTNDQTYIKNNDVTIDVHKNEICEAVQDSSEILMATNDCLENNNDIKICEVQEIEAQRMSDILYLGECFNSYLIAQQGDDLLFIDKHAAHERIIYEQIKSVDLSSQHQLMLTPLILRLGAENADVLLKNSDKLFELGFTCEDFGAGNISVLEIPSILDFDDAEAVLYEISKAMLSGADITGYTFKDNLMHTIACKNAIKAGWSTSEYEKKALIEKLNEMPDIKYCPHGRPIVFVISKKDIEKSFKRIV